MKKGKRWVKIVVLIVIVLVVLAAAGAVYAVSQKSDAEAAALRHAGLNESEVGGLYSKLEMDGLSLLCEVSFWTADSKYEYEVTAFGHEVIHFDKEPLNGGSAASDQNQPSAGNGSSVSGTDDPAAQGNSAGTHHSGGSQQNGQSAAVSVSDAEAKAIALKHAGVKEDSVMLYQSKIDHDNGRQVYEIEFYSGEYEYEYEIDCASGEIVKYERDKKRP